MSIKNQRIVITGAGGSVGKVLVNYFSKDGSNMVEAVDRSEKVVAELFSSYRSNKNVAVHLCDVREKSNFEDIIKESTIVIHAAAIKHVSIGAEFPSEVAQQNVAACASVLEMAKKHKIGKIVLCSTDKAATPSSVMGASKYLLERMIMCMTNEHSKFSAVRFGNILNSSASVVPKILENIKLNKDSYVTDDAMTRYVMGQDDFLHMICFVLENMDGGEIFLPQLKTVNIRELITCIYIFYSQRFGEKSVSGSSIKKGENIYNENIHERMINPDEVSLVKKIGNYFVVNSKKNLKECDEHDINYLLSSNYRILSKKGIIKLLEDNTYAN